MREAITLLQHALAIDPSYAPAAALIGWCRVFQRFQGWGSLSDADVAEGVRLARQAIEAGKDDPDALWMAANAVSFFAGDHATASAAIDRSLILNPNSAYAWFVRAFVLYRQNQPDHAIEALERTIRLSPLDPLSWIFTGGLSAYHVIAGRYEEAIEWADRSLRELPRYDIGGLRNRVVACAHLGRIEEARDGIKRLLELQPWLSIAWYKATYGTVFSPQFHAVYIEGLRKAGLPEE